MIPAALALQLAKTASQALSKGKKANKQKKVKNGQHPPQAKKLRNPNAINSMASPFAQALSDPFAPSSLGCKVPDPYPFPTQSYHLHQTTVLGTIGSNVAGGVMFLPSPTFSLIDTDHCNNVANNSVISTSFTRFGSVSTNPNYGLYASTGLSTLAGVLETYRVVSWGIKISNLQPELSATGRIIIAMLPIADTVPTTVELSNSTFLTTGLLPVCGVPMGVLDSANLLQLPTSLEFTVGDLLHGDLELSGMYTSGSFWNFKTPLTSSTEFTGYTTGDQSSTNGTVVTAVGFKDSTRMCGGVGIAIYYEGIPVNTSAFQVETIYHLEGTPSITSNSAIAPVPSNMCKPFAGTSNDVEKGMTAVNSVEKAMKYVDRGANFLNKNKKTIVSVMAAARGYLA
nr:MAG: hypothetical protein [Narnaviridae sp.]